MSQQIEIVAELRKDVGKGASRRLRRADQKVPGIVYGGTQDPQTITLNQNALKKVMLEEAFYSQILNVVVDGTAQQAVLRDIQRHPSSEKVLHVDFLRVSADHVIHVSVPVHFLNEDKCVGVRLGGGSLVHNLNEVEVACLPKDLPEYIEVDMTNVEVGNSVYLSDLVMPAGVELVALQYGADHDTNVVSVRPPRGGSDAEGDDAEGDSEG